MNKMSSLAVLAFAFAVPAWSADTSEGKPAAPTTEQVMEQFRTDMQAAAADVMAKGLTLTADQAAKFWPMFDTFQKEQKAIIDEQLKAALKYREHFGSLSDADAVAYVNSLLERDQKIHDLRAKYLAKFEQVVPTRIAARAIQIDRRLGLVSQVKISSQIPLIR